MSKKLVITFEGIEGSGKSLHIKNIVNYLSKKKVRFIELREPGGSKNAEKIRKLILFFKLKKRVLKITPIKPPWNAIPPFHIFIISKGLEK